MIRAILTAAFLSLPIVLEDAGAESIKRFDVIVAGESYDGEMVPRNSRVFRQVSHAIQDVVVRSGYRSFDAYLNSEIDESTDRFYLDQICDTNSMIDSNNSVALLFSIHVSTRRYDFKNSAILRLTGRIIDCRTDEIYAATEARSSDEVDLPIICPRECLIEEIGEKARGLGKHLGNMLVQQLDRRIR